MTDCFVLAFEQNLHHDSTVLCDTCLGSHVDDLRISLHPSFSDPYHLIGGYIQSSDECHAVAGI